MTRDDYWNECVATALADAGIAATEAQIAEIAETVAGAHECYGMAFGDDVASSNLAAANEREKADLRKAVMFEREKVNCRVCDGAGHTVTALGTMVARSQCHKCHGAGRVHPSKL